MNTEKTPTEQTSSYISFKYKYKYFYSKQKCDSKVKKQLDLILTWLT